MTKTLAKSPVQDKTINTSATSVVPDQFQKKESRKNPAFKIVDIRLLPI
jgi:hypothetical protein